LANDTAGTVADATQAAIDELAVVGVSIDEVTQTLDEQGVKTFADAFITLLESIEQRRIDI
jgi:hypothetical protein